MRWKFYDPVEDEEYLMPVNPNVDSSQVGVSKSIDYQVTAGGYYSDTAENPGSYYNVTIMHENPDEVKKFSFSGNIYTAEEYYNMVHWANKTNFFDITDDLENTYTVYVTQFTIERVRARRFPWKHRYNLETAVRSSK